MIATFLNINADKFSLNGVESFKIFIPVTAGDRVMVVNAFDGRRILLNYTNFADVTIDGQSFANVGALVNALNSVIFAWKASDGGGPSAGNYTGVSSSANNALLNGADGMPFLDESRFNFEAPTQPGTTAHGIISFNSGYIDAFNFQPSATWDFAGTRYNRTKGITLAAAPTTAGISRIDVAALTSAGDIVVLTGTAASNPQKPVINPDTQIEATFFIIEANATAPAGVTGTPIYNEFGTAAGGEWNATETTGGARIQLLSGSQTKAGNYAIEATNLQTLDKIIFTPPTPRAISEIKEISLNIKNKPGDPGSADPFRLMVIGKQANGRDLVQWLQSPSVNGYNSQNSTAWQFVSFAIPATTKLTTVEKIEVRSEVAGWGFFMDVVKYTDGTTENQQPGTGGASVEYVDQGDASTLAAAKAYAESLQTGGNADSVKKRYLTWAALLADQPAQVDKGIYFVADASGFSTVEAGGAYFEYLGTTAGTEADYRKMSEEESMDLEATLGGVSSDPGNALTTGADGLPFYTAPAAGLTQNDIDAPVAVNTSRLFEASDIGKILFVTAAVTLTYPAAGIVGFKCNIDVSESGTATINDNHGTPGSTLDFPDGKILEANKNATLYRRPDNGKLRGKGEFKV